MKSNIDTMPHCNVECEVKKMGVEKMPTSEYDENWKKQNTLLFSVRLQKRCDADIIERIESAPSRQGELKRLVRLGIEYEKLLKQQQEN